MENRFHGLFWLVPFFLILSPLQPCLGDTRIPELPNERPETCQKSGLTPFRLIRISEAAVPFVIESVTG